MPGKTVEKVSPAENGKAPELPVDDAGRLAASLRCTACDYNLRGLALDGVCPECGKPVGESLLQDDLRLADPIWLRKVRRGLFLLMLAIGSVVGLALVVLLARPLVDTIVASPEIVKDALAFLMALLIYAAAPIVAMWGLVLSTTPEPPRAVRAANVPGRRFARWATLGVVAAAGLLVVLSGSKLVPPVVMEYGRPVAMFLPLVPLSGLLRVLGGLLGRTKESKLARKAKQSSSGMLGFVVLLVLASVVCATVPKLGKDAHRLVLGLGVLIGLVCLASVFTQFWRVRRVLGPILADAEDSVRR